MSNSNLINRIFFKLNIPYYCLQVKISHARLFLIQSLPMSPAYFMSFLKYIKSSVRDSVSSQDVMCSLAVVPRIRREMEMYHQDTLLLPVFNLRLMCPLFVFLWSHLPISVRVLITCYMLFLC